MIPCPFRRNHRFAAVQSRQGYLWGSEPSRSVDGLAPVGIDEESYMRNRVPIQGGVGQTVVNLR